MKTLAVALCALSLVACASREHLAPNFGVATHAALHAQLMHPDAGEDPRAFPGLDPQEAAVVSDTYFRSLSPGKSGTPPKEPVLIIQQPQPEQLPPPMGGPK